MEEDNKDVYQAAKVVLIIIKNEGSITDDIEYPEEFRKAYDKLLALDIVQIKEGEYIPGKHFTEAYKLGVREFEEKQNAPSPIPEVIRNNYVLGIVAGTAIATLGYLIKTSRKGWGLPE